MTFDVEYKSCSFLLLRGNQRVRNFKICFWRGEEILVLIVAKWG